MKGDFSRSTFDRNRHYSGVLQQQGRVQVDADWNEFVAINAHRRRQLTRDLIGPCGGPIGSAGFAITPGPGNALTIGAGQYYVHGLLVENESDTDFTAQPDLLNAAMPTDGGTYLAWLDVWERHLTALDDNTIREVALGGPDTATRAKVIWQVKLTAVEAGDDQPTCVGPFANWDTETAASTGQLAARAQPSEDSDDPCVIKPGAGYRRLENQLYRVEIHDPGADGAATFKWSRDNGTIVTRWIAQSGNELEVASIGLDAVLRFSTGDWVELLDDERDLGGLPGTLVKLVKAEGTTLTIDPATATGTTAIADFGTNLKVRRWDMPDGPETVEAAGGGDTWLALEDGVEVQFQPGAYRTGDYWLIPARTATSDVEWPKDGTTSAPIPSGPLGIHHHYCRLALLGFTGETWTLIHDCRDLFPPVTQLTRLYYLGGDGQEVAPDPTQPTLLRDLPAPLRAGVANGRHPVANARVRFRVTAGNGRLQGNVAEREVATGPDGLAETTWALSGDTAVHKVEAELLDAGGTPVHLPIVFTATLSQAERVSYDPKNCPPLAEAGAITVQRAIDELCKRSGGAEPGMRIKDIIAGGEPLINDTDVAVERIAPDGIQIHCDQTVAQVSVRNKPVCFLTLELPYPVDGQTRQFWNVSRIFGFQPIVLEASLNSDNNVIFWRPSEGATEWLRGALFPMLREMQAPNRLVARLTAKGNFIWSAEDPNLFLDGDAFGQAPGGAGPTEFRQPIGDERRGGDLDMWFWLVERVERPQPDIRLTGLALSPDTVVGGVASRGSVALSGAAPAGGVTVKLASSNRNAAAVPEGVAVRAGARSASFPIETRGVAATRVQITATLGNDVQRAVLNIQVVG